MFFTYILKSKSDGSFYKGQTDNLENRLKRHNSGKVTATKARIPWVIAFTEKHNSREEALKREKYLKSAAGRRLIKTLKI